MTSNIHIVIIGAGLAGTSAAAEIAASQTVRISVIERLRVGSNHTTPMTFAEVPGQFGLEDCIIGRYRQFTFHSHLGAKTTHTYESTSLIALDYERACQMLLARAQASGHVELLHASASRLQRQNNHWLVQLANGETLSADLIIDASGRGLFSHKALGIARPKEFSHCYGAILTGVQVPDPSEALFLAPASEYGDGGGWIYPLEGNRVSFGYASLSTIPQLPTRLLMERFRRALDGFEPYATQMRNADWERAEVGSIPIYPLRRLVADGLLIIGDAAGQATIWSCMGSAVALEAGQLAGQAASQAVLTHDFSMKTLNVYQRNWDNRHRHIYRNNAIWAPVTWGMSPAEWNRQIPRLTALTPPQMIERLRTNWPVPPLPVALWLRAYDIAGRARRGLVKRLRSTWH